MTSRTIVSAVGSVLLLLAAALPGMAAAQSSPITLEILNIKPAGTGSPAIHSSNRIFRAYPGVPYNIRAAVIGGAYPYRFELRNAPAGMTINTDTGEIDWANPQSNAGPITIAVTDSRGGSISSSWSITVGTAGFVFLDSSYSGSSNGSIGQPYKTIAEVIDQTDATNIVYVRKGTYTMPSGSGAYDIGGRAATWIGYPGETVTFEMAGRYLRYWQSGPGTSGLHIDRITFQSGVSQPYFIVSSGGWNYHAFRRSKFLNLNNTSSSNENQGFIYFSRDPAGYGAVFQDNLFQNFAGGHAIGSLYDTSKALIEGNILRDGGKSSGHGFSEPIGVKTRNKDLTIRGNRLYLPDNSVPMTLYNELQPDPHNIDYSFNLVMGGANRAILRIHYPTNLWMYRNTFVNVSIEVMDWNPGGIYLNNNVLQNVTKVGFSGKVTQGGNLEASGGLVDQSGNLLNEEYIGRYGHQISGSALLPVPHPPSSFGVH